MLLQHNASPSMREEGSNAPIFLVIQMSSAENVLRLLQYSVDRIPAGPRVSLKTSSDRARGQSALGSKRLKNGAFTAAWSVLYLVRHRRGL